MRRVAGMAVMTALLGLGVPAQVDAQESDQVAFKTGALEVSMSAGGCSCKCEHELVQRVPDPLTTPRARSRFRPPTCSCGGRGSRSR